MSMYNMIFGENSDSETLLKFLGLERDDFYRYRDCYLDEQGRIAVYTRAGGGNRECYCWPDELENSKEELYIDEDGFEHLSDCKVVKFEALRKHPLYLFDRDDNYDTTYATYYFQVPEGTAIDNIKPKLSREELWQLFRTALER